MNLGELAKRTIYKTLEKLHVAMPASVVEYDATTGLAAVQINIPKPLTDGTFSLLPPLQEVPIFFPGGGGFTMSYPISQGDTGLIHFCDYDISGFVNGGSLDPQARQHHRLSDAVFIPATHKNAPFADDGLSIKYNECKLSLEDGAFTLSDGVNTIKASMTGLDLQTPNFTINGAPYLTHIHQGGTNNGVTGVIVT